MEKALDRTFGTFAVAGGILSIAAAFNAFDTAEVLRDGTFARAIGVGELVMGIGLIGYGGYVFFREAK